MKLQARMACFRDGRMAESDVDGQNGMFSAIKGKLILFNS